MNFKTSTPLSVSQVIIRLVRVQAARRAVEHALREAEALVQLAVPPGGAADAAGFRVTVMKPPWLCDVIDGRHVPLEFCAVRPDLPRIRDAFLERNLLVAGIGYRLGERTIVVEKCDGS